MKKHLKLFSLIALAIAGIGVSFASTFSHIDDDSDMVEVSATTKPQYIYIAIASTWSNATATMSDINNLVVEYSGGDDSGRKDNINKLIASDIAGNYPDSCIMRKGSRFGFGADIIKLGSYNATSITLIDDWAWSNQVTRRTGSLTIPSDDSLGGHKNMYILDTNRTSLANQAGFWTWYDPYDKNWGEGVETDTMYIAVNYNWEHNYKDYFFSWPRINITFEDVGSWDICAYSTLDENIDFNSSNNRTVVFCFPNMPIKRITSSSIYMNPYTTGEGIASFNRTATEAVASLNGWCDSSGNHTANFFGIQDGNGSGSGSGENWSYAYPFILNKNGCYHPNDNHSFISGSFAEYDNINRPVDNSGNLDLSYAFPTESNSFVKTGNVYKKTMNIDKGDSLRYHVSKSLSNTSDSSSYYRSTYDLDSLKKMGFDLNNVSVFANGSSTPVPSSEISNYIQSSSGDISFNKGGIIELEVNSTLYTDEILKITFLEQNKSAPAGTADQPDTTIGKINDNIIDHTATFSDFVYNPASARYELYVAAIANDTYIYMGGESPTVKSASTIEQSSAGLITDGTGGDAGKLVIVSTGYYIIGWYPYNSAPSATTGTKAYKYFIDQVTTYNESCATALAKRIISCQYCSLTKGEAASLNTLYNTLSGVATRDTVLSNFSYYDYDQLAYRDNGQSYDGLDRTNSVSAKVKYDHVQDIASKLPAGLGNIGEYSNLVDDKNALIVMVIVVSSTSLLVFSLAATMIVRKKKRLHK